MKRICHVSPHLPPDQAANALLPALLGAWARARGDEVRFVAHEPAQGGERPDRPDAAIAWVPRRPAPTRLGRFVPIGALPVVRNVERALDRAAAGVDLLHLHSNGLIIEVAARFARRHRLPYVLTLYGTEIWHYRRRFPFDPFRRAYFGANVVTFYSRLLMQRAQVLGLDRPQLSVVYPPVSDTFVPHDATTRGRLRRELGIKEPRVIVNVKRLHPLAGQRHLIDAFAALTRGRDDVRLVVCGTGPLAADLASQARAAGVGDRVTFTGLVANDLVAKYCGVADVFALPSLLEALPTVAVEALASGTPVVSADHPGGIELHELFGDDVALVPREDAVALAAALGSAIDRPRRTNTATADRLEQWFRPAAVMAAYDEVYRAACG
jgi:glycosyltransferase involved in cell wall biosynthesis